MKRIVLCADDYGLTNAISQGILKLIDIGRLSATSCLVNTSNWPAAALALLPHRQKIDIGLHINFTEGEPMSAQYRTTYGNTFFSLTELLKRSFLKRLLLPPFMAEAEAQMEHFISNMKCLPSFLDGHQHVHQFPGIRGIIINLYKKYFPQSLAYIRVVNTHLKASFEKEHFINNLKKITIMASGLFFQHNLMKCQIPHNSSFTGIYPFHTKVNYQVFFRDCLNEIKDNGLIMCHPGLVKQSHEMDVIAAARVREYEYLSSALFVSDCLEFQVLVQRFDVKKYRS